jgi:hypothetical protein
MSEKAPIGRLVTDPKAGRDAIHVAIAPCVAAEDLEPGQHVGLVGGEPDLAGSHASRLVGIVDPFLTETVRKGQRFYLCLYPNTVTTLRHHWSHPAFDEDEARKEAATAIPVFRRKFS